MRSVGWSEDGRRLVSGSDDERVRVHEERRGVAEWQLGWTIVIGSIVYGVTIGGGGGRVAVAADDARVIIGVESGNEVARLASTSESRGSGVGWSRDGRHVVIGQVGGLVSVYEADGWREVWHRQIDGAGWGGVGVTMTRCGKWVGAAP